MIHDYLQKKIEDSYDILRLAAEMSMHYYQKPLIVCYSGGKDSDAMLQLALECLKPEQFEVLNSHTTVDAPETVYYIRDKFKELESLGVKATIQYPRYKDGRFKSMWTLIVDKDMPPTRLARYCCKELKETTTPNRFAAVGTRASESSNRRNRDSFAIRGKKKAEALWYSTPHVREVFETAKIKTLESGEGTNEDNVWDCNFITRAKHNEDLICQPIYMWTDSEIWQFIEDREMKYNPLYDKGYTRIGCIGCPMNTNQVKDLEKYPKIKQNYINAFQRLAEKMQADKNSRKKYAKEWTSGEAIYKWWVNDTSIPGQMNIYDFLNNDSE